MEVDHGGGKDDVMSSSSPKTKVVTGFEAKDISYSKGDIGCFDEAIVIAREAGAMNNAGKRPLKVFFYFPKLLT